MHCSLLSSKHHQVVTTENHLAVVWAINMPTSSQLLQNDAKSIYHEVDGNDCGCLIKRGEVEMRVNNDPSLAS
jgi:hypothetical protein